MRVRRIPLISFALMIAALTSACGLNAAQRNATSLFASASTDFGDATATELVKMHDQTIAMNGALYGLPDLKAPPGSGKTKEPQLAEKLIDDGKYNNLAEAFSSDWYAIYLSGPVAMKAYGTAITKMMNADNSEQIKKASDDLAAALKAIPNSPAGNASAAAISAISQQLTEWVLDDMKAHAIRDVVQYAKDAVTEICSQVAVDFRADPNAKNLPWRYRETARLLYASSETSLKQSKSDYQKRKASLDAFLLAKDNLADIDDTYPKIAEASIKCQSANTALVASLSDQTYSIKDIQDFYNQVKGIYQNVKLLNK